MTDVSDDDVSDDEMEEFFTDENLDYAKKILEVRFSQPVPFCVCVTCVYV